MLLLTFLVGCQTKVIVEEKSKEREKMNVEEIRKLGRKGIIDLAVEKIKQMQQLIQVHSTLETLTALK